MKKSNDKQTNKNTCHEKSVIIFCKIVLFVRFIGGQIEKIECAIKKVVALTLFFMNQNLIKAKFFLKTNF